MAHHKGVGPLLQLTRRAAALQHHSWASSLAACSQAAVSAAAAAGGAPVAGRGPSPAAPLHTPSWQHHQGQQRQWHPALWPHHHSCQPTRRHSSSQSAAAPSSSPGGQSPPPPQQQEPGATPAAGSTAPVPGSTEVLYRGTGMRLFRLLVRMKVFQLAAVGALAVPINTFLATGQVSSVQAVMAGALVVGCGVASTALYYYSRRYVGELALAWPPAAPGPAEEEGKAPGNSQSPGRAPTLVLSTLDFWGRRQNDAHPLAAVVPPVGALGPAARRLALADPLLPLEIERDRRYILSMRYGQVLVRDRLEALLAGELPEQRAQRAQLLHEADQPSRQRQQQH